MLQWQLQYSVHTEENESELHGAWFRDLLTPAFITGSANVREGLLAFSLIPGYIHNGLGTRLISTISDRCRGQNESMGTKLISTISDRCRGQNESMGTKLISTISDRCRGQNESMGTRLISTISDRCRGQNESMGTRLGKSLHWNKVNISSCHRKNRI